MIIENQNSLFRFSFDLRTGTNVTVRIPVPKATVSVSHEALGPGQVTELRLADKVYTWKLKKIDGGDEQILLLKVRNIVICTQSK